MWENIGYYEILGLTSAATTPEIKRAYFATVRKYPPERFPEEFKRVKEAYNTLANPESRLLYDQGDRNPEVQKYLDQAKQAYDQEDYDTALDYLEKALQIAPHNSRARNLTGFCYMDLGLFDKAITIYKNLTCEFPDNDSFFFNLGEAYAGAEAYKKAQDALENSLRLEKDNAATYIKLGYCHFKLGKSLEARRTLEEGLRCCGPNVSLYFNLIQLDLSEDDQELLRRNIARLVKLAKTDAVMQENVAWALMEIAEDLMEAERPELAMPLLTKAKQLNPAQEIKDMVNAATKQKKLLAVLKQLQDDPLIHPWLKEWLDQTIHADQDDNFFDPIFDLHINTRRRLFLRQPANLLSSAQRIREHYPAIFKTQKKFFQDLLNHPDGYCDDETKLLEDFKYLSRYVGQSSESDLFGLTLDDFFIPPMPRVNVVKVGRNDPCPCGSGKKYKKCCMR
jgi:preprotein translocase subunit SecA